MGSHGAVKRLASKKPDKGSFDACMSFAATSHGWGSYRECVHEGVRSGRSCPVIPAFFYGAGLTDDEHTMSVSVGPCQKKKFGIKQNSLTSSSFPPMMRCASAFL